MHRTYHLLYVVLTYMGNRLIKSKSVLVPLTLILIIKSQVTELLKSELHSEPLTFLTLFTFWIRYAAA